MKIKVSDAMTKKVSMISADTMIKEAASIMLRDDIGDLPIEDGGKLVGMLTDRDIVIRAIARGLDPGRVTVGEIMTGGVVTCTADQSVDEAIATMEENKIRRLVVLDRNNQPIGVVSLGDLAAHAGSRPAGEALKEIASPVHSQ